LKNLYLDNCTKLTDDGLEHLAGLSDLRELTVNGCLGITDKSLETMQGLKSLKYLVIANCPGLSREGATALKKALPDCRIVRD
jgi:hypothetical protein